MELTTREIATAIITVGFVLLTFSISKDRKGLLRNFLGVTKALASWKVAAVMLTHLAFLVGVVAAAYFLGVWSSALLKDTIIIGSSTGLPILLNSTNFRDGLDLVKHVKKEVLGVAAFLVPYVNLTPFPLWGELILQVILLVSVMIVFVAKRDAKTAPAGKLFEGLIIFIVLGLIVYVTVQVITRFNDLDWKQEALSFALSLWLPVLLIPFIYVVGLIGSCEATLIRAKFRNDRNRLSLPVKLGFLVGVHGSLRNATSFTGRWSLELATQNSFRPTLQMMRQYRRSVRYNACRNRSRRSRLKKNAGIEGVDKNNLWLDRREFHETKGALEQLFYSQMSLYRHRGSRYWDDPIVVFPIGGFKNLPEDHGVRFSVSDDGQTWRAWRRTAGGFYFGVGGTSDLQVHWRYAGAVEPTRYPNPGSPEWVDVSKGTEVCPEWNVNDGPFRSA